MLVRFPDKVVAPLQAELEKRGLIIKFFNEPQFRSCARITLGTEVQNTKLLEVMRDLLPRLLAADVGEEDSTRTSAVS